MNKFNEDDLKVGQKVTLVKERPEKGSVTGGFIEEMAEFLGKKVTIRRLSGEFFEIEEDCKYYDGFVWDYKLIKGTVPQSKVHEGWTFGAEDFILPCGYILNKVIENENAVICFVEEEKTKKIIKTVAICQNGDKFDLHKGVEICMYKTLRKIADKNLKRF